MTDGKGLISDVATPWSRVTKFNRQAARLADQHYSRRTVGSPQFMPPGRTQVYLTADGLAVWGSHWPRADLALDHLDAWRCSIFRNCSFWLSSFLIPLAMELTAAVWERLPADGWVTYVDTRKVRSRNPGYCFKIAGWRLDREYQHRYLVRLRFP